jgi:hypothetical protein
VVHEELFAARLECKGICDLSEPQLGTLLLET